MLLLRCWIHSNEPVLYIISHKNTRVFQSDLPKTSFFLFGFLNTLDKLLSRPKALGPFQSSRLCPMAPGCPVQCANNAVSCQFTGMCVMGSKPPSFLLLQHRDGLLGNLYLTTQVPFLFSSQWKERTNPYTVSSETPPQAMTPSFVN